MTSSAIGASKHNNDDTRNLRIDRKSIANHTKPQAESPRWFWTVRDDLEKTAKKLGVHTTPRRVDLEYRISPTSITLIMFE